MLASDSDTGSDWDSDSADACGPLKQAWGVRDMRGKNLPNYDFVSNLPQDGEEYLMAVMNERRKTPVCVAADVKTIDEIKKRKSTSPLKPQEPVAESGQIEGVKEKLEKLELKTEEVAEKVENEDFEKVARFLPTPKWRANQLTQFNYIRMKMDLARDMMLQGRYYVVPSFTKFEKDRLYWLRYCFGTLDAATMIDIKRAKKQKAKELYDESKKPKSEAGDEESSDDSQDGDVEIVSKEEAVNLEQAASNNQKDDLMKISGGSFDDLVVVPQQGDSAVSQASTEVENQTAEDSAGNQTEDKPADEAAVAIETTKLTSPAISSEAGVPEEALITEKSGEETKKSENIESAEAIVKAEAEATSSKSAPELVIEEIDPIAVQRKLNGQEPTTNLLLSMPQRLVEYLLSVQLEWLKEFGLINRKQGTWLYATMSCLQVPFEPDVICDLRQIALQCVRIRDLAKQCILDSEVGPSAEHPASPITLIKTEESSFGLIDVVSSCNLFISIVVDYFIQKDLNKFLTYDGRDEF